LNGFAGHLHLEAAPRADGRTVLAKQSFRAPFHLGKSYWEGGVLQVRVVNATAGILSGDRLDLAIRVQRGAALLVLTPAATRAFMMRRGAAECRQTFTVEPEGWLEYAPEPLFPHRDSDYTQTTRLDLAAGAEMYYADALAPGRTSRGEVWAWRNLRMSLDVMHGGEPVLRERLTGTGEALGRRAARFGTAEAWFGTVIAVSPKFDPDDGWGERLRSFLEGRRWIGATRLRRGGWIIRMVAPNGQALRDSLAGLRALFTEKLPQLGSNLRRL
jgi:urease accessory protein